MKRIFLSPPHIGDFELKFVQEAFASNYIAPLGPQVDAFEKEFAEYVGIRHCVALSSGTAAMHLALGHLGIGPGHEVLASTLTFIGSVTPVTFLGARPVFVDCDRETWNMDPELLAKELAACAKRGKLPKAVVPTDLYGQCCDYGWIFEICARYEVPVVVDAAEAMGAFYSRENSKSWEYGVGSKERSEDRGQRTDDREWTAEDGRQRTDDRGWTTEDKSLWAHAGKGGAAAVFSFNGNKIVTTSGGGMLASDDKGLIDHARFLSQQARDPFPHYEHSEIGYNYRMSNILAAVGRGQLQVLDERVKRKREIFDSYYRALQNVEGIEFIPEPVWSRSNRWLTVILITPAVFGVDREQVRLALEAENIESRPVWKPMHLQPVFGGKLHRREKSQGSKPLYPARVIGGRVAEDLFNRGLCLPSGTAMSDSDLQRIIDIILACYQR